MQNIILLFLTCVALLDALSSLAVPRPALPCRALPCRAAPCLTVPRIAY